ncbi:MAG: trypsin-like serine protease [Enterobacteriaceae bacterium]
MNKLIKIYACLLSLYFCTLSSAFAIWNGTLVHDAIPYIAAIESSYGTDYQHGCLCGATWVAQDKLVTAAHCLYYQGKPATIKDRFIIYGGFDLSKPDTFKRLALKKIDIYPYYNHFYLYTNDIAVVQVETDGEPHHVVTIAPAFPKLDTAGTVFITYGFGVHDLTNNVDLLRYGYHTIATEAQSIEKMNELDPGIILDQMNNFGALPVDHQGIRPGDSGSPALVQTTDGSLQLFGIAASGFDKDIPPTFSVYTRTQEPEIRAWLYRVIY